MFQSIHFENQLLQISAMDDQVLRSLDIGHSMPYGFLNGPLEGVPVQASDGMYQSSGIDSEPYSLIPGSGSSELNQAECLDRSSETVSVQTNQIRPCAGLGLGQVGYPIQPLGWYQFSQIPTFQDGD